MKYTAKVDPKHLPKWYADWEKLMNYLEKHPQERFFQGVSNAFGFPYLGSADNASGEGFEDLFFRG